MRIPAIIAVALAFAIPCAAQDAAAWLAVLDDAVQTTWYSGSDNAWWPSQNSFDDLIGAQDLQLGNGTYTTNGAELYLAGSTGTDTNLWYPYTNGDDFTFAMDIYPFMTDDDKTAGYCRIAAAGRANDAYFSHAIRATSVGTTGITFQAGLGSASAGGYDYVISATGYNNNQKYRVLHTVGDSGDGRKIKLFIDGAKIGETAIPTNYPTSSDFLRDVFSIGVNNADGAVDRIMYYTRALTDTEAAAKSSE